MKSYYAEYGYGRDFNHVREWKRLSEYPFIGKNIFTVENEAKGYAEEIGEDVALLRLVSDKGNVHNILF